MRFSQVFSAIAASPFQTLQTPFGIGNQIFQFNGKAVLKKVEVLGIRVSPRCFSKSTTANPLQCIAAPLLAISQGSRAAFVSGRRRWRCFAGWICVTQPVVGSHFCMDAVGGDFDFG